MSPPELSLLRLLQLASPSLPVGAYAYSQGLEWAVAAGWVDGEASLRAWLGDQLDGSFARTDLPIFVRLCAAARRGDAARLRFWSRHLIALRETRELVADDCERGRALARLLSALGIAGAEAWASRAGVPFATPLALAAAAWELPVRDAAQALAWTWLEGQVLAGVKLVPLGQVAGQRLLLALSRSIPALCDRALACDDDEIGGTVPIVALASSLHETQYTRLFRS